MESTLRGILTRGSDELTLALERQVGIHAAAAARFVDVAGAELVASYEWQKADLNHLEPADPRNARALLSAVCAGRIARDLGLSVAQVWGGLRAFVPLVLQLAGPPRPASQRWAGKSEGPSLRFRRTPLAGAGFLHPVD